MQTFSFITKSALFVLAGMILSRVFGYVFRILIARTSLEVYGFYTLALLAVQFVLPFVLLGTGLGLSRFIGHYRGKGHQHKADRVTSTALIAVSAMSLLFFCIFFLGADWIAGWFHKPESALFFRAFAFLIPLLGLMQVFGTLLKAHGNVFSFALVTSVLVSFLELVFLALFLNLGWVPEGIVAAVVVPSFLAVVVLWWLARTLFRFTLEGFDIPFLRFSLLLLPASYFFGFLSTIDSLVLGHFSSTHDVAVYNAALPTAQMILLVSTALLTVFLPLISEHTARRKRIAQEYAFVIQSSILFALPLVVFALVFRTALLGIFFGPVFISGSFSFALLTLAYFFYGLALPGQQVLIMLKKTKLVFWLSLSTFALAVILTFSFIPWSLHQYGTGMYGASFATLLAFLFLCSITFFFAQQYVRLHLSIRDVLVPLLAASISAFVVFGMYGLLRHTLFSLVVAGGVFMVLYGLLIVLARNFLAGNQSIRFMRSVFQQRK